MDELSDEERTIMTDAARLLAVATMRLAKRKNIGVKQALTIAAPLALELWADALKDHVLEAAKKLQAQWEQQR